MRCLDSIPALADDPISALRDDRVDDQNPALFDDRQQKPSAPPPPPAPVDGRDARLPPPGTVLTRAFKGTQHRVTVREEGIEYDGQLHRSLSSVAKLITGTAWNGFTFFGLKDGSSKAVTS
ncbi:DUF2924 domain-containing protein [Myxococcus sp. NMCA1]|uniref:DUF2924 domain-containing protein n=1 Tax=Myxococcus sp. NMCA1 TaxID=2996785 RepID=UPI003FA60B70